MNEINIARKLFKKKEFDWLKSVKNNFEYLKKTKNYFKDSRAAG